MAGYDFNFINRALGGFFNHNSGLFPKFSDALKTTLCYKRKRNGESYYSGSFKMKLPDHISGTYPDAYLFEIHAYEGDPEEFARVILKDGIQRSIYNVDLTDTVKLEDIETKKYLNSQLVKCLAHIFTKIQIQKTPEIDRGHTVRVKFNAKYSKTNDTLRRIDHSLDLILKSPTPPPPPPQ